MKCPECEGRKEYYQKYPDCINCESYDRCGTVLKEYCIVPSDCDRCVGTGEADKLTREEWMTVFEKESFQRAKPKMLNPLNYKNSWLQARWEGFYLGIKFNNLLKEGE